MSSAQSKAIPVTVLHGFLGSGKTTLLRNLLSQSQGIDVPSVIVNDMSELDVDGVLIMNTDLVNESLGNFATISGDSVSSPKGIVQLEQALDSLLDQPQPPTWIIVETSGSSHPLPIIELFKRRKECALKGVVTLVDATWLRDDYQEGTGLIPKWQENLKAGIRGIENLLVEQMLFSNQILLTKSDRIAPELIQKMGQALHPINPYASIVSTSWGRVRAEQLINADDYNYFLTEQLANELRDGVNAPLTLSGKHNQSIVAKVLKDDRPFHPQRLWQVCHQHLTHGVFRSKGFFWLPTRDDVSLLWSQTNGSVGLEIVGFWRAAVIQDEGQNYTPEQRAILQKKIDDTESRYGDRRCRLTVIGQEEEAEQFIQALQRCFLTDQELEHWQSGGEFDDPWPKQVAKL